MNSGITETSNGIEIRTQACPNCLLCGSKGELLYSAQSDRLFGAGGSWNSNLCSDPGCNLIWLDPMPLVEDIGKAYENYYTHGQDGTEAHPSYLTRLYRSVAQSYIRAKFGYPLASTRTKARYLSFLLYLMPIRRRNLEVWARFLPWIPSGKLLDVGCGSGVWLEWIRKLGWDVQGVDFDPEAVKAARLAGLNVKCGSVEDQNYPSGSFDAIILYHVIEHVPDPIATLRECARLLKSGGTLVIGTPNGASLGHRFFKQDWRGLEPPRHLHIFSPQSLQRALNVAGFEDVQIRPDIGLSIVSESLRLRRGRTRSFSLSHRKWSTWIFAYLFTLIELCRLQRDPSVADCMVALVTKR